ncbi:MAG TPA: hypothetical protein VGD26_01730 [Chitinophagaceae bacterium]
MSKRAFTIILLVAAVASLGYAVYRSTAEKVTLIGPTQQTVFGEPQHGLILGLCLFAGACLLGAVMLLLDKREETIVRTEEEDRRTIEKPPTYHKRFL